MRSPAHYLQRTAAFGFGKYRQKYRQIWPVPLDQGRLTAAENDQTIAQSDTA